MLVSVIIPTRGRHDRLLCCLSALKKQVLSPQLRMEVIVAVDAGEQTGFSALPVHLEQLHMLRLPDVGAAAARNAAIKRAQGELLIFTNDDTYPEPDWVSSHVAAQARRGAPGMVIGQTRWMQWPNATVFDGLVRDTSMIFFYDQMTDGQMYGFRHFWTCNASVPAAMVRGIGGFEAALRPVFYEDCELAFRLEAAGRGGVFYHAAAVNHHDHRVGWAEYCERERRLGRMAARLARVNPACFVALFRNADIEALRRCFERWLELDCGDHDRAKASFEQWIDRPLAGVAEWPGLCELLYRVHLPLKRRLFRESFVAELRALERESINESGWIEPVLV